MGLSGSIGFGDGIGSLSGNVSSGRQAGDFASVTEQSRIDAGDGGYSLRVAGDTTLVGGVIASTADESKNSLTTGTLHASDLENREQWSARQTSIGGGLGGIGADRKGQAGPGGATPLPGVPLGGLGRLSAAVPVALSAGGVQSGVTRAAIAPGAITLTSGDAASQQVADTISRDTAGANEDPLRRQFTDTKREEVADGFRAAQVLTSETGAFFARKGKDEAELRAQAKEAKERGDQEGADRLTKQADQLHERYGAGSAARLVATALGGAAGVDVTGSLGGLARASAVNALQGLAATQVKRLADGLRDGDGAATLGSEAARAGLHAVVGCAGQAAGGAGDCGSAALGAASAVVLNNLLSRGTTSATDADGKPLTLEVQQARDQLMSTLAATVAAGAGLDAHAAVTSARTETENNSMLVAYQTDPTYGVFICGAHRPCANGQAGGITLDALKNSKNKQEAYLYKKLKKYYGSDAALEQAADEDQINGAIVKRSLMTLTHISETDSDNAPGRVSSGKKDPGGVSYGVNQLSSVKGTAQEFVDSPQGTPWAAQFADLKPGTEAFSSVWKRVAQDDPEGFAKAQDDFMWNKKVLPFFCENRKGDGPRYEDGAGSGDRICSIIHKSVWQGLKSGYICSNTNNKSVRCK